MVYKMILQFCGQCSKPSCCQYVNVFYASVVARERNKNVSTGEVFLPAVQCLHVEAFVTTTRLFLFVLRLQSAFLSVVPDNTAVGRVPLQHFT
jgi:hypothetical protein